MALRFNLFSALSAATAASFVTATAQKFPAIDDRVKVSAIVPVAVGLTLAFAPLVWGQALITEVYALNLAVLAALLWALLTQRSPWLVGLLWGLSLTTHLTSVLMLPLVVLLRPTRQWPTLFGGACLGVLPLLALPLLAAGDSAVIWGEPTTFSGWLWLVSGALYRPNLVSLAPAQLAERIPLAVAALLRQFGFIGWLLLPVAFIRSQRTLANWLLLGTTGLYAAYALNYNSFDHVLYFLPGLLTASLLLIPGMRMVGRWALILPLFMVTLHFGAVAVGGDTSVRTASAELLGQAPVGAVLITTDDENIFSLWYFQHVEGLRPDLILVDANLLGFDWYRQRLSERYPTLAGLQHDDVDAFMQINALQRPVCTGSLRNAKQLDCSEVVP
jgi:hypothetical protein